MCGSRCAIRANRPGICWRSERPALTLFVALSVVTGLAYPLLTTGVVISVVLERADHVGDEVLGMQVDDARRRVLAAQLIADRVHQVRLAEAGAAVDEQRVVGLAGVLRDLLAGGACKLVRLAGDEAVEGEA